MRQKLQSPTNPLLVRRIGCAAFIALCLVLTAFLLSRAERRAALAHDASIQSAWQHRTNIGGAKLSAESVYSRFAIKAANTTDLIWQAASATELRASLRALDAAEIRLTQVKVNRSGTGYAITAERAP